KRNFDCAYGYMKRIQASTASAAVAISMLWALCSVPVLAQVTGRLSGTVADPSGKNIKGARIVLYLAGSDVEDSSTTATEVGSFLFGEVRSGFYDLSVEASGFQKLVMKSIKVDPLAETTLPPLQLTVGAVTAEVVTMASEQTLNTSDAQVSATVRYNEVA